MKDLKITLGGQVYLAPPPKAKHFKDYILLLRYSGDKEYAKSGRDIEFQIDLMARLFQDDAVTAARLGDALSLCEMAELNNAFLAWLGQYLPNAEGKNAKTR